MTDELIRKINSKIKTFQKRNDKAEEELKKIQHKLTDIVTYAQTKHGIKVKIYYSTERYLIGKIKKNLLRIESLEFLKR